MSKDVSSTPDRGPANDARIAAVGVVTRLCDAGHVAYLAGGCVRDRLLGFTPQDYDVATDAPPDVVGQLFPRSRAVGEAFGVVLVYVKPPQGRHTIEVATFREDGPYNDGRRPDTVTFTDARHDAERRDFTVNALFEDPLHPQRFNAEADADGVIDYVGGRADLTARVLRAVGDPGRRFNEDYLRMLRAVRFTARLGFELDPGTAAAIRSASANLGQISRERIGQEVKAMLLAPTRYHAVTLLGSLSLDGPTLAEECLPGEAPTVKVLDAAAAYGTVLAAWLLDRHGGSMRPDEAGLARLLKKVSGWQRALALSNADRDALKRTLRYLAAAREWSTLGVAARKRLASAEGWSDAILLLRAMGQAELIERDMVALAGDGVGLDPEPLVTGDDLIRFGVKPGPRIGRLLNEIRDAQLEGRLHDQAAAVTWVENAGADARG